MTLHNMALETYAKNIWFHASGYSCIWILLYYFDCLHIASSLDRCHNFIIKDLIVYISRWVSINVHNLMCIAYRGNHNLDTFIVTVLSRFCDRDALIRCISRLNFILTVLYITVSLLWNIKLDWTNV